MSATGGGGAGTGGGADAGSGSKRARGEGPSYGTRTPATVQAWDCSAALWGFRGDRDEDKGATPTA